MKKQLVTLKVAAIVEDFNLYVRHSVDEYHAREIADHIEWGGSVPPIIVDKASMRLIDGFHRVRAYRRLYGSDAAIKAELRRTPANQVRQSPNTYPWGKVRRVP